MKIACISPSRVPAQTANSIQMMKACHALGKIGNEIRLWIPGEGICDWSDLKSLYGLEQEFQITWQRSIRWLRRYDFAFTSIRQARQWGADMVYTWLPQAADLALWQGVPAILEVHDRPTGHFGPFLIRRFCGFKTRKRLVVITQALKHILQRDYQVNLPEEAIIIAPNGVDFDRFASQPDPEDARKVLGLTEKLTAGFSGHFYPGRGTEMLYDLAREFPKVQFLWIGGREQDIAYWRKKSSDEGIKNIILTGFIENSRLPIYLAAAEVLLIPFDRVVTGSSGGNSAEICSPMKMFEYMAAGRAIVTSELPVIREVLNERNAVFCPPEDFPAWKTALTDLFRSPTKIKTLGLQARKDATQFTWQTRAEKALRHFLE